MDTDRGEKNQTEMKCFLREVDGRVTAANASSTLGVQRQKQPRPSKREARSDMTPRAATTEDKMVSTRGRNDIAQQMQN